MIGGVGFGMNPYTNQIHRPATVKNPGESMQVNPGRKSSPAECETCKNRKYKDGSDEMVSFKSAAHISPAASAGRVMVILLLAEEGRHMVPVYPSVSTETFP